MTRDIIAEFSCSLNNNGTFKQYHVVTGSSFTDQYNETLDSAVILLSQVTYSDRLTEIKPYDFVRIYDRNSTYDAETHLYAFDHIYLVDNFYEKEDRIKFGSDDSGRLFSYTIDLMSLTKLLEKIQCPNLTITHKVDANGNIIKKTIFEKICEYMELYIPKVKKAYLDGSFFNVKWRYEPLIENPGLYAISKSDRFNKFIGPGIEYEDSITIPELIGEENSNLIFSVSFTNEFLFLTSNPFTFHPNTGQVDFRYTSNIYMRPAIFIATLTVKSAQKITGARFLECKPGYESFYNKFNVTTADLGSANFTLRQLLTMLMQQVGCIPTVNRMKIGFLDFNDDAGNFALNGDNSVNNTVNYVQKSLSSDSFVNSVVNMTSNVLDSGNEVISETLGFRDKDSVTLKQQSNLFLETKFPIYKVNSFKLNCLLNSSLKEFDTEELSDGGSHITFRLGAIRDGNSITVSILGMSPDDGDSMGGEISYKITTLFREQTGKIVIVDTYTKEEFSFSSATIGGQTWEEARKVDDDSVSFSNNFDSFLIEASGTLKFSYGGGGTPFSWSTIKENIVLDYSPNDSILNKPTMVSIDITPLIKEQQERSLLEKNYKNLELVTTINDLSRYIYGTVGYTIGSKTIEGFSSTFSKLQKKLFGLEAISEEYTYIECIYNWLKKYCLSSKIIENITEKIGITIRNVNFINSDLFSPNNFINFTQFTFDIKYQPLNSFNLSFVKNKDGIDYPLEQYSGSDSGLTDFDRLSLNQQETVDRVGNATLSISQRITPEQYGLGYLRGGTNFKPVYYTRDGITNTIFKRVYTVGNYKYDVSYTGSENAILKDYFTSIRTKYRAYQYVDYNSSTLRKEKDVIYVRISEGEYNYFNGDDKIYFADGVKSGAFVTGCLPTQSISFLKYLCEKSVNKSGSDEVIKNDISLITNDNCFAIIYEQFDNVSAGPYVASSTYNTYYDSAKGETESDIKLAGVPQSWQEWKLDTYSQSHIIYYTSNLNYYDRNNDVIYYASDSSAIEQIEIAAKSPVLPSQAQQIKTGSNVIHVVNNKTNYETGKTFFKDDSERLNHTVQFIYYSVSDNIAWTENFVKNNNFVHNSETMSPNRIYSTTSMSLNKNSHTRPTGDVMIGSNITDFISVVNEDLNKPAHILVTWGNYNILKICYQDSSDVYDFIVFKRPSNLPSTTKFYVTLNDTKSDYVLDVTPQGMPYRRYKVKTGTLNRTVNNIYNEQ